MDENVPLSLLNVTITFHSIPSSSLLTLDFAALGFLLTSLTPNPKLELPELLLLSFLFLDTSCQGIPSLSPSVLSPMIVASMVQLLLICRPKHCLESSAKTHTGGTQDVSRKRKDSSNLLCEQWAVILCELHLVSGRPCDLSSAPPSTLSPFKQDLEGKKHLYSLVQTSSSQIL